MVAYPNDEDTVTSKNEKLKGKTLPPSKTPGQSDVEAGAVSSNLSVDKELPPIPRQSLMVRRGQRLLHPVIPLTKIRIYLETCKKRGRNLLPIGLMISVSCDLLKKMHLCK